VTTGLLIALLWLSLTLWVFYAGLEWLHLSLASCQTPGFLTPVLTGLGNVLIIRDRGPFRKRYPAPSLLLAMGGRHPDRGPSVRDHSSPDSPPPDRSAPDSCPPGDVRHLSRQGVYPHTVAGRSTPPVTVDDRPFISGPVIPFGGRRPSLAGYELFGGSGLRATRT
jgi:hypothetical protein